MAGRFMKVKRIVIPFISVVILISQLTGCATLSSREIIEEMEKEVVLEYVEPQRPEYIQVKEAVTVQESPENNTLTIVSEPEETEIGLMETAPEILEGEDLERFFKIAYEINNEDDIEEELIALENVCSDRNKQLPSNFRELYKKWKELYIETMAKIEAVKEELEAKKAVEAQAAQEAEEARLAEEKAAEEAAKAEADRQAQEAQAQQQAPEVIWTFTDVNETVYATGSVNIRSGPGTEYNKIGSLSASQSITRTGIGTGDTAKWSRVKLSDGTTAYIASSYLTTTKPAASQPAPSQSNSTTESTGSTSTSQSNGNNSLEDLIKQMEAMDQKGYIGSTTEAITDSDRASIAGQINLG